MSNPDANMNTFKLVLPTLYLSGTTSWSPQVLPQGFYNGLLVRLWNPAAPVITAWNPTPVMAELIPKLDPSRSQDIIWNQPLQSIAVGPSSASAKMQCTYHYNGTYSTAVTNQMKHP
jgi:hypothetical protein